MSGRYEVFLEGEEWSYRYRSEAGRAENRGDNFPSRSEALAAAKAARGDKHEELFRGDGSSAGVATSRGAESIVLLNPDGSVYGELDHEVKAGGTAQQVTLAPATENSKAGDLNG